jgi:hypothetical protein
VTIRQTPGVEKSKDPRNYSWFELKHEPIELDDVHPKYKLELKVGERFGLRKTHTKKTTAVFLVDEGSLHIQYKLSEEQAKDLIGRSFPFRGKIEGRRVHPGRAELILQPSSLREDNRKHRTPGPVHDMADNTHLNDSPVVTKSKPIEIEPIEVPKVKPVRMPKAVYPGKAVLLGMYNGKLKLVNRALQTLELEIELVENMLGRDAKPVFDWIKSLLSDPAQIEDEFAVRYANRKLWPTEEQFKGFLNRALQIRNIRIVSEAVKQLDDKFDLVTGEYAIAKYKRSAWRANAKRSYYDVISYLNAQGFSRGPMYGSSVSYVKSKDADSMLAIVPDDILISPGLKVEAHRVDATSGKTHAFKLLDSIQLDVTKPVKRALTTFIAKVKR